MKIIRPLILIVIGGLLYTGLEMLFRQRTHWTMFVVGGICFYLVGLINEIIPWEMPLWQQSLIGSLIITTIEFISGCIINIWLGWNVWDYSNMFLNFLGQICLPFSAIWYVVSCIIIFIDYYLRYTLGGEKPNYKII